MSDPTTRTSTSAMDSSDNTQKSTSRQQPPLKRGKILPEKRLFQLKRSSSDVSGASLDHQMLSALFGGGAAEEEEDDDRKPAAIDSKTTQTVFPILSLPEDLVLRSLSFLDATMLGRIFSKMRAG